MLALANACTLPSVWVVWFSVPGSSESACSRFASSEEIAWKLVFDEEISDDSCASTLPTEFATS